MTGADPIEAVRETMHALRGRLFPNRSRSGGPAWETQTKAIKALIRSTTSMTRRPRSKPRSGDAMTAETRLADISEFQPSFDAGAYLKAGNQVIIARTYNGSRPDHAMPARRAAIRAQPFTRGRLVLLPGIQVDPAAQARGFIATVGTLARNEFPILDLEEGSGDQTF